MYVVKGKDDHVHTIGTMNTLDEDEPQIQTEREQNKSVQIPKEIIICFEEYQKARLDFVVSIEQVSQQSWNIPTLHNGGIEELLKPMILDNVPTIQNAATLALARIASYSEEMAETVAKGDLLHQLVYMMQEQSKTFKLSAAFLLRSVAKQSSKLAGLVVEAGGVEVFVQNLEVFDPDVKEASVWGLDYICRQNAELAQSVVDLQGIPPLLLCVQEPEIPLKRIAVCTLTDMCKHTRQLATTIVEAQGIEIIAPLLNHSDIKLRTQVCALLAQIGKHSEELARLVIEKGKIFPYIVKLTTHPDAFLKKNATVCLQVITKHTEEFANLVVQHRGLPGLVANINETQGSARYAAIITIGNIAGFSESLADAVLEAGAVPALVDVVIEKVEDYIKSFAAISLGKIGHSSKQVHEVAKEQGFLNLLQCYCDEKSSEDLKKKCKESLQQLIKECRQLEYINPLLKEDTPSKIFVMTIRQLSQILSSSAPARKAFVKDGGLQFLQQMLHKENTNRTTKELIYVINAHFPEEVVKYYTPNYDMELLKKI